MAEPSGTAQGAGEVGVGDVAAALEAMASGFEKSGARGMGLGIAETADVAELRRLAARLRSTAALPAPALTPPAQGEPRGARRLAQSVPVAPFYNQKCAACGEPWRLHPAFAPLPAACKAALDASAAAERAEGSANG